MTHSDTNEVRDAFKDIAHFIHRMDNPYVGENITKQTLDEEVSKLKLRTVRETYIETPSSTLRITNLPDDTVLLHVSSNDHPTKWYSELLEYGQAEMLRLYTEFVWQGQNQ